MKEVTVVIPNYNGKKFLKDCIESLYSKNSIDFDLIIVDNCSTDSDYKFLNEYKDLKFEKLDKNYGFAYAVNVGIKKSNTKYVVLLNNDTVVFENYLSELLNLIKSDDKIFAAQSMMIKMVNKDKLDNAGDYYNILGWGFKGFDGKSIELRNVNRDRRIFSCCGASVIYRKDVFEEIGYFDEEFFAYLEDIDVSYRAMIHGYKNMYCHKSKIYHFASGTTGSKYNNFKVKISARNNIFLIYKNMPLIQILINFPFLFLGFIVKYLFFVKKGFGKVYAGGIKEGFKNLNRIEKTKFKAKNLFNYIKIEILLVKNLFLYVWYKLF